MTPDEALRFLPHGPEFRFIDRVLTLSPGREATAEYLLRPEPEWLKGHFPGHPMMPGVLLIEGLAQLAGVAGQSDPSLPPLRNLKLTAVRNAKIFGTARPGQTIQFKVRVIARLGGLIQASGEALLKGSIILQGEVVLSGEV